MLKIIVSALIIIIVGFFVWEKYFLSAPAYKGPKSNHFNGKQFVNLKSYGKKNFWDVIKWRLNRKDANWPSWVENKNFSLPQKHFGQKNAVSITFINHATVLIQVDGINILTDPIWSERASPFTWAGPKRVRNPGISLNNLPPIDVVLISHNHYDHTDVKTLLELQSRFHPTFITGLGNDLYLKKIGLHSVTALDWWGTTKVKELPIYYVPAQHFSGRGFSDRMKTLWGGFVLQSSAGPVYFSGDTAWGPQFELIEKRFGPIFFAMLPIGAYMPRDFMKSSHIDPQEAVHAFQLLKCQYAMGIHFDTFANLADEPFNDAVKQLHHNLTIAGISQDRFIAMGFGENKIWRNKRLD